MTEVNSKQEVLVRLRKDAVDIFQAGLAAVDPIPAVKRKVQLRNNALIVGEHTYDLSRFERVLVIGSGKASAAMARALEEILGDRIQQGFINVKYGHCLDLNWVRCHEAGHPVPDAAGLEGAHRMVEILERAGERDLLLCLLSGGGSALFPYPAEGVSLQDKQELTGMLLDCGATIQEINALRKHISRIKGGRMARIAHPATLITLILSDVIGDDLDSIASGPTVPDRFTYADCVAILEQYNLRDKVPSAIWETLELGLRKQTADTPKAGDPVFSRTFNLIVASNTLAMQAAGRRAEELGYNTLLLSSFVDGETREVARVHAAVAKEILKTGNPVPRPACVLSGGETTVTIRGKGVGGRNQEFVLAAARAIQGLENVVVLSAGTDGTDGPTDAAGALADGNTVDRALEKGLKPLRFLNNNDSYHFFQPLNDLLKTGPTLTNVMDLRVLLVG